MRKTLMQNVPEKHRRGTDFMNGEAIVLDNGERYKIDTQANVL